MDLSSLLTSRVAGFLDDVLSVPLQHWFSDFGKQQNLRRVFKTQIWGIHPRISDSVGQDDVQQTEFLTNVQVIADISGTRPTL